MPQKNVSYNAYLLKDKKNALIDTTATGTAEDVLENIKSLIDPKNIDDILLTHADFDHVGGLSKIWPATKDAKVITFSNYGKEMVSLTSVNPGPAWVRRARSSIWGGKN